MLPKFPECEGCINRELDPFQCGTCINGSKFEGEDTSEELTYDEFVDFIRGEA